MGIAMHSNAAGRQELTDLFTNCKTLDQGLVKQESMRRGWELKSLSVKGINQEGGI